MALSDTGRRYHRWYSLALRWYLAAELLHNPRGAHELRQNEQNQSKARQDKTSVRQ